MFGKAFYERYTHVVVKLNGQGFPKAIYTWGDKALMADL